MFTSVLNMSSNLIMMNFKCLWGFKFLHPLVFYIKVSVKLYLKFFKIINKILLRLMFLFKNPLYFSKIT